VYEALRSTQRGFVAAYDDTLFLAIRVDDPTGQLAAGLEEAVMDGTTPLGDSLGFATVIASAGSLRGRMPSQAGAGGLGLRETAAELASKNYQVLPLRKRPRAGKPYEGHVSVGRARNNDVVLRDSSVSKFHAWFQRGEGGVFYVADGRSKNTTKVNRQPIASAQTMAVAAGDRIAFGTIETILISPGWLWELISK
jgi:hypothetical protein